MKTINSCEDLVITLASQGDPAAFFSISQTHLTSAYVNFRNGGKNHEDALGLLKLLSVKLYRSFLGSLPENLNEWFKQNSPDSASNQNNSEPFDLNLHADTKKALENIQLVLQRESSHIRKKNLGKSILQRKLPSRKLGLLLPLAVLIVFVVLGISAILIVTTGTTMTVSLANQSGSSFCFYFPHTKAVSSVPLKQSVDSVKSIAPVNAIDSTKTGIQTIAKSENTVAATSHKENTAPVATKTTYVKKRAPITTVPENPTPSSSLDNSRPLEEQTTPAPANDRVLGME